MYTPIPFTNSAVLVFDGHENMLTSQSANRCQWMDTPTGKERTKHDRIVSNDKSAGDLVINLHLVDPEMGSTNLQVRPFFVIASHLGFIR